MRGILVAAAVIGMAAGLAVFRPQVLPISEDTVRGLGAGALLGIAGSLAGFWLLVRNLHAGHGRFLMAFFGGMMGRLILFGLVLVLVVRGEALPLGAFLGGLIPGYLGFQAAEMWYLHRSTGGTVAAGDVERHS